MLMFITSFFLNFHLDLEDDFEEDVFSDDELELAVNKRASQISDSMVKHLVVH